jgi:hypothetical protein
MSPYKVTELASKQEMYNFVKINVTSAAGAGSVTQACQ